MQERFLSIVSGLSRHELISNINELDKYSKLFNNISLQTGIKSISGIEEMIQRYQPQVVVIDYLEKIKHELFDKGMDTQAISQIMREFASMAMKYNIVIIVVSQINRQSAALGKDDKPSKIRVHSGKGSSSIETSSRRIFSIEGDPNTQCRRISLIKANNDRLFSNILIERQNNWRFIRK
jgi:hypothetical protein